VTEMRKCLICILLWPNIFAEDFDGEAEGMPS
jgi:hypothetical protein